MFVLSGDLHCHTRLSDGTLGIEDLIAFAKKKGLETIAITDHDCLAGTVRSKVIGARHGIQVIPGVELSSTDAEAGIARRTGRTRSARSCRPPW